jgi:hypothetical protein
MNLSSLEPLALNLLPARLLFAGAGRIRQRHQTPDTRSVACGAAALAKGVLALYVGSSEHFAPIGVVRRDQNVSHLTVFEHLSASLLAR